MNQPNLSVTQQDLAALRPLPNDEIDLGELIRNLIEQWKLICAVTFIGALLSVAFALSQSPVYLVEAEVAPVSEADLGKLNAQPFVAMTPTIALEQFAEQILSVENQSQIFSTSALKTQIAENTDISDRQLFETVRANLTIQAKTSELHVLEKDQVAPINAIKINLETAYPEAAADYLQNLIDFGKTRTLEKISLDAASIQSERLTALSQQLNSLSEAATVSRLAQIKRIEESHNEKIAELELQLITLEMAAKDARLRRIEQLNEALATAQALGITTPVTWQDLRNSKNAAQIVNDLSDKGLGEPLYFRGSKFLAAEIKMLTERKDDLLYVDGASQIKADIEKIKADPHLATLKNRQNDAIFVEQFNVIQAQIADLKSRPLDYSQAKLILPTQQPIVPVTPIKPNKKLIVVAGTVLAGFLALFIALIRLAIKPNKPLKPLTAEFS